MNANSPPLPEESSENRDQKQPTQPTPAITPPPLSSPQEPTRAYPTDPSRTYSSDPSKYSTPQESTDNNSTKNEKQETLDAARIARDQRGSFPEERQTEKEQQNFENKTNQQFESKEEPNKMKDFYDYTQSNRQQTITYILLILGLLILLFANSLLGGLMLGMVGGFYFSSEIMYSIRNLGQIAKKQGHLRYVVLTALLLGLFIAAPGIFIGAIIVATFKQVMAGPRDSSQ